MRIYRPSDTTDPEQGGRLYACGGIQGIQSDFRGLLMKDTTTDIDMVNAHPTILKYICNQKNILCPNLKEFIANRDKMYSEFENRSVAKELFLCSINSNHRNRKEKNVFFKAFDKEMKAIQEALLILPDYAGIKALIPEEQKLKNLNGSLLNRIVCAMENKLLHIATNIATQKGYDIATLVFDGFLIYGNHYDNEEFITILNTECERVYPGLHLLWSYKAHSEALTIPEDYEGDGVPANVELSARDQEAIARREKAKQLIYEQTLRIQNFEQTHCKIKKNGVYIVENPILDENTVVSLHTLELTYKHEKLGFSMFHLEMSGALFPESFIQMWTSSNPDIRMYDDMDVIPNPDKCPKNIYNLWTPFAGEKLLRDPALIVDMEIQNIYIEKFRNHIDILCNHETIITNYFIMWLAQMIQFPDVKTICPILISLEGAGKGTLMKLIQGLLGKKKYQEVTKPERDITGNFNLPMASSFFVNLNEIKKKDLSESMGVIKGLITDHILTINPKGLNQYDITSHHRFIITTNTTDPIDIKYDNRRFMVIRSSDELKGNTLYFNELHTLIEDNPKFIRTIYHYLKNLPYEKLPMPVSQYQQNIQESNVPEIEKWLKSFTLLHSKRNEITILIKDLYEKFSEDATENGCSYKITSKKFQLELANLSFKGIYAGTHTRNGYTKIININELKTYFNIGCLVTIPTHTPPINNDADTDEEYGCGSTRSRDEDEVEEDIFNVVKPKDKKQKICKTTDMDFFKNNKIV